jgi:phosphatidylglycerol:prolipoprotein diacylglycerol transferase
MIHVPTTSLAHPVFDLLAWSGSAALGVGLGRWRLRKAADHLAVRAGPAYFAALAGGAIPGAWLSGSLNTLRSASPTLSHSVVGALAGAIVGVEIYKKACGIRGSTGGVFVGPFALGVVIGRVGCLLSGLGDATFGVASRLPWAVDLGDGVGRHPVQLYEALSMAGFLGAYLAGLARRAPWAMRRGFYALCLWYGAQRFAWEFLKPYPPAVGPFNLFHLLCGGLVIYAAWCWRSDLGDERRPQGCALSVPRADHELV